MKPLSQKLYDYFLKNLVGEREYIVRKFNYYKGIYEELNSNTIQNLGDIENLLSFELILKDNGINLDDLSKDLNKYVEREMNLKVTNLVNSVLNFPVDKLFRMAQYNENKASIMRIEHDYDVKLDKTMKRRIPQLMEIIQKNNLGVLL